MNNDIKNLSDRELEIELQIYSRYRFPDRVTERRYEDLCREDSKRLNRQNDSNDR